MNPNSSPGLMSNFGENIPEEALQAVQAQSQAKSGQSQTSSGFAPSTSQPTPQATQPPQEKPREVGTLTEELVKRPLGDIGSELKSLPKSLFSVESILGIEPSKDDPQMQVKKKAMLDKFNNLTKEEQVEVQKRLQKEQERKQRMEEEKIQAKQQAQANQEEGPVLPSSPGKGPVGPATKSKKSSAVQKLEQDRKSLGGPQSAN